MTLYVDKNHIKLEGSTARMWRVFADNRWELTKLGTLRQAGHDNEHVVVPTRKKTELLKDGAVEVGQRQIVKLIRSRRQAQR